jgi:hypothetical protein
MDAFRDAANSQQGIAQASFEKAPKIVWKMEIEKEKMGRKAA